MDSEASEFAVSNINTHGLPPRNSEANTQNQGCAGNGNIKLFSLSNIQSQSLAENDQSAKRFAASTHRNLGRQPFVPTKRLNTASIFQGQPRGGAHILTKPSLQLGKNFKLTPDHGSPLSQDRRHPSHTTHMSRNSQNSPNFGAIDYSDCRIGASMLSHASPVPMEGYNDHSSPLAPTRIPDAVTPKPSQPRPLSSQFSGSPFVVSQHHDPDAEGEDSFAQAMRLGSSQLQQYKAEVKKQHHEIRDLQARFSEEAATHGEELTAVRKELSDLKEQHEKDIASLKESSAAELSRVKDEAKRDLDTAVEDTRMAREELSRVKEISDIHAQRDRTDIELARSKVEELRGLAKKAVETSNRRYSELQAAFHELKTKHDETHREFQSVATELRDVRVSAGQAIKSLSSLCGDDVMKRRNQETKALIAELQQDRDNSQQVNEILRGKLLVMGSQLADAQERVRDLESQQITESAKLELCTRQLADAGMRFEAISSSLSVRERDALQALAEAARFEERAKNSEDRCEKLLSELHQKTQDVAELESVKAMWTSCTISALSFAHHVCRNAALTVRLDESNKAALTATASHKEVTVRLAAVEDDNRSLSNQLAGSKSQVGALKVQCDSLSCEKSKFLADLSMAETRIRALEMQMNTMQSELERSALQIKASTAAKDEATAALTTSNENIRTLERKNGSLGEKLRSLEQLNETTQRSLETAQHDLKQAHLNAQQAALKAETFGQMLHEHFDGQRTDLRERLIATEASSAIKLDAANNKLQNEINTLRASVSALGNTVGSLLEENKAQREATVQVERRASQQETIYRKLVETHEERAKAAERDVSNVQKQCGELQHRIFDLSKELELAQNSATDPSDTSELTAQLHAAQRQVHELQEAFHLLELKGSSMLQRYQDGSLDDGEKAFVASLMQRAQSIHEDELIAKVNELRRKENMITSLQKKILTLESALARRLQAKDPEIPNPEDGNNSIININGWVLSSPTLNSLNVDQALPSKLPETLEDTSIDPRELSVKPLHMVNLFPVEDTDNPAPPQVGHRSAETPTDAPSTTEVLPVPRRSRKYARKNAQDQDPPVEGPDLPTSVQQATHVATPAPSTGNLLPRRLNFAQLDSIVSDLSDPEDDIPLAKQPASLGKHPRSASPAESLPSIDIPKPPRKVKPSTRKQANPRPKQTEGCGTKAKLRKR